MEWVIEKTIGLFCLYMLMECTLWAFETVSSTFTELFLWCLWQTGISKWQPLLLFHAGD